MEGREKRCLRRDLKGHIRAECNPPQDKNEGKEDETKEVETPAKRKSMAKTNASDTTSSNASKGEQKEKI